MDQEAPLSLMQHFEQLADPRVVGRCDHKLVDIIVLAVCGVISGAETWVDIETFGRAREDWLKGFLELTHGIPSHDTIGRVFAILDAEAFQVSFMRWVESVFRVTKGQVISLDGKTACQSYDKHAGTKALHLVNAWASQNGIALGQFKTDMKSNELTAIPPLLRLLEVSGCIITLDAMGAQTKIAQAIRAEKADYVLRIKDNQGNLHQDLHDWFAHADQVKFVGMNYTYAESLNKGHGRIEIRRCWALSDPRAFEYIRNYQGWTDLQTIIRLYRERRFADKVETETAYYISSLPPHAATLLAAIRDHWAVENSLHWVLDVIFHEDDSRIRTGDAPFNMAILRRFALNILKKDRSQASLRTKRYQAALNVNFLEKLFDQI